MQRNSFQFKYTTHHLAMILFVVCAWLTTVHAHWSCEELCKNRNLLHRGDRWPSNCYCVQVLQNKKRTAPQFALQTLQYQKKDDTNIYYEPAKTSPSMVLYQPFYIINPTKGIKIEKRSIIQYNYQEPNSKTRSRKVSNKSHGTPKVITRQNDIKTKFDNLSSLQRPDYIDVDFSYESINKANSNPNQSNNLELIQKRLIECMDLNLLAYARKKNNKEILKKEVLRDYDFHKYFEFSDSELNQEIKNKCKYSMNFVKKNLQEIIDNHPKKKNDGLQISNSEVYDELHARSEENITVKYDEHISGGNYNHISTEEPDNITISDKAHTEIVPVLPDVNNNTVDQVSHLVSDQLTDVTYNEINKSIEVFYSTSHQHDYITTKPLSSTGKYSELSKSNEFLTDAIKITTTEENYLLKGDKPNTNNTIDEAEYVNINTEEYQEETSPQTVIPLNLKTTTGLIDTFNEVYATKDMDPMSQIEDISQTKFNSEEKPQSETELKSTTETVNYFTEGYNVRLDTLKHENNGYSTVALTTDTPIDNFTVYDDDIKKEIIGSGSKLTTLLSKQDEYNCTSYTETEIAIQKIITRELPNDTVISESNGTELLPTHDFEDSTDSQTVEFDTERRSSESVADSKLYKIKVISTNTTHAETTSFQEVEPKSDIVGKLYFVHNEKKIPARFIQDGEGIHIGIDALSICESVQNNSLLLYTICKCIKQNNCTIT